jgi:hypothetical protein
LKRRAVASHFTGNAEVPGIAELLADINAV